MNIDSTRKWQAGYLIAPFREFSDVGNVAESGTTIKTLKKEVMK